MLRRSLLLLLLGCQLVMADPDTLELNQANRAQLESLPGIGPALAERMIEAREKQAFSDWADLLRRVQGIGRSSARKLSDQGLRINGQPIP